MILGLDLPKIDYWGFLWAIPFLISGLTFRYFFKKNTDSSNSTKSSLVSTMYSVLSGIVNTIVIWVYTFAIIFSFCFVRGEKFEIKDNWKPMLPVLIYFGCTIILSLLSNNMPIFTTIFSVINFILNNTIAFYLVGALIWYRVLKSSYDKCF